jgi:hypothetical protein
MVFWGEVGLLQLACDALKLGAQLSLNVFRMPLAAGHSTYIGTVNVESTRDPAVKAT